MDAFGLSHVVDRRVAPPQVAADERGVDDALDCQRASDLVVQAFLGEAGEGGRALLATREAGLAVMARQAGVALSTVHTRWQRVVRALRSAAGKYGADREALSLALEHLVSGAHSPA
jgi:hypothetical protein